MFIPEPNRIPINHPLADEVSIIDHAHAYCEPGISSEIAFFVRDAWVTDVLSEFADYADAPAGDTLVYCHVPNDEIDSFLETYRA